MFLIVLSRFAGVEIVLSQCIFCWRETQTRTIKGWLLTRQGRRRQCRGIATVAVVHRLREVPGDNDIELGRGTLRSRAMGTAVYLANLSRRLQPLEPVAEQIVGFSSIVLLLIRVAMAVILPKLNADPGFPAPHDPARPLGRFHLQDQREGVRDPDQACSLDGCACR